jgi:hypothetical protein
MVMSVVMQDAALKLGPLDQQLLASTRLGAILYAGDTLLFDSAESVTRLLATVADAGAAVGLKLHPDKSQLLAVNGTGQVKDASGHAILPKSSMVHLGALMADNGAIEGELARRIGAASGDFRALSRVWGHSSLSRTRKLEIFNATIISKLSYGLATAWLNTSARRRLNGFQNRSLRSISGIKPSFVSLVSNEAVLKATCQRPLCEHVARQQLLLYGKAARASPENLLRSATFCSGSLRATTSRYVQRRGRPALEWTSEVGKMALRIVGSSRELDTVIGDAASWRKAVIASDRVIF